jgi:hypothetical protein
MFEHKAEQAVVVEEPMIVELISIHEDHNKVEVFQQENIVPGHRYTVTHGDTYSIIKFQEGPVKEHGVNGLTNESLLAILIHRTEILNSQFPCDENKIAIDLMKVALKAFESRTKDRLARAVEGENKL